MIKYLTIGLFVLGGFAGGMITDKKLTKLPACNCNCPPAVEVELQKLDLEKLNNKKGSFYYQPNIKLENVTVKVDTALAKQILKSIK